jgi:putative ABC transport system ATP-binding protein
MTAPAIEIENLSFAWPKRAELLHIDALRVARGARVFLKGPSGSGKSTLLGLIGGVLTPGAGSVRLIGTSLGELSAGARDVFRGNHVGFIFQMFNLIPYLNVLDNIILPCRISHERQRRLNGRSREDEARKLAGRLGIGKIVTDNVIDLSVGQQQRVAAARALLGAPELIIADEPTSSLDEDHREGFLQLLFEQCRDLGSTLIYVSHDRRMMPLFDRAVSLAEINRV